MSCYFNFEVLVFVPLIPDADNLRSEPTSASLSRALKIFIFTVSLGGVVTFKKATGCLSGLSTKAKMGKAYVPM